MGTTRRDFLKGLMATTAVAALPVAAAEAVVYSGVDWATGPSITAYHMARGQAFFFLAGDGHFWEVSEGIYRDITPES